MFGSLFAAKIRKRRVFSRSYSQWRWHLDEVFVKINGERYSTINFLVPSFAYLGFKELFRGPEKDEKIILVQSDAKQ